MAERPSQSSAAPGAMPVAARFLAQAGRPLLEIEGPPHVPAGSGPLGTIAPACGSKWAEREPDDRARPASGQPGLESNLLRLRRLSRASELSAAGSLPFDWQQARGLVVKAT